MFFGERKKGEIKKRLRSHDCKKVSLFFFKFNTPKKYHKASSSASSVSKAMRPGVLKVESNKVFFAGAWPRVVERRTRTTVPSYIPKVLLIRLQSFSTLRTAVVIQSLSRILCLLN